MISTTPDAQPFQLDAPDIECRYPVHLTGTDQLIGHVFRWHGAWMAVAANSNDEIRVSAGRGGDTAAARYLFTEYSEGRITPTRQTDGHAAQPPATIGPVPLLHPRMRVNAANIAAAEKAMAGLAAHRWTPRGGYPGSDNPWYLACQLCEWHGPRYWSHLRGRNGNPPSPFRHEGGCIGAEEVRARITAYRT